MQMGRQQAAMAALQGKLGIANLAVGVVHQATHRQEVVEEHAQQEAAGEEELVQGWVVQGLEGGDRQPAASWEVERKQRNILQEK